MMYNNLYYIIFNLFINCVCFCVYVCVCADACLDISSQILKVHIINVEEYEKQENFFIILEDPKWLKRGLSGERMCVYLKASEQEVQH